MKPDKNPKPSPVVPAPKKRLHLDRLEERIAPGLHQNPHTKLVGGGKDSASFGY